jgi:hypothetical protein
MVSILSRLAQVEPDLVQRIDYDKSKLFTVTATAYKIKHPNPAKPADTHASEPKS